MHSHCFNCNFARTDVPMQEQLTEELALATVPASIADLFRCTPAKVSTHVVSQTKLLPPLNGKTVIPSGRNPSLLSNPGGSKTDGRSAFRSALLSTFIAECLGKRPALYLLDKPCKTLLSILTPQRQEWRIQASAPTLKAMAALRLSESSSVQSTKPVKHWVKSRFLSEPWTVIWL